MIGTLSAGLFGVPAPLVTNSYESISTVTVGTAQSTIEFTSIPSTYKHLQLRCLLRSTAASASANTFIRYNSDTGNNYGSHILRGDGSTVTSSAFISTYSYMYGPEISAATATANIFGVGVIDILDYANTSKNKVQRVLGGNDRNGSGAEVFVSGLWLNTSAINSISFTTSGNFAQYSQIDLYGIKD